jgi:ribonuclease HI
MKTTKRALEFPKPPGKRVKESTLHVFTDGSCPGNHQLNMNKRKAGWAVCFTGGLETFDVSDKIDEPASRTNNIAEMMGLRGALRVISKESLCDRFEAIEIHTDNDYSRKCITVWGPSWKANGWRKRSPGKIKNLELIRETYELLKGMPKVNINWTKGHSKDGSFFAIWNGKADAAAKEAAASLKIKSK